MYWQGSLGIDCIINAMSRDTFEEIKKYLHFNNNSILDNNCPNHEKLNDAIRKNCSCVPPEEHQSIDEQITPTKARISLKQYNPKKPHKWGYKGISRAGSSGYIYDFEVYTGNVWDRAQKTDNGLEISSEFGMTLSANIPHHRNYKLVYDN
ncbi:unnamed protein product [Lepeophtheirus salmonis]|uniref:(salmon louse) hypothetical protein n=1 Tax=Lepeophtheirus salmonis TaxID=72036 RepID=A0A7R8H313_LEPSM|nr:unnamed protein product [Lepeophtheirus salmonis]CAF2822575.1 unnamed protein product [Lepeophtheirus salmonis]